MDKTLFSFVLFIGIFGILAVAFYGENYAIFNSGINGSTLYGNASFLNTTLIEEGTSLSPPICQANGGLFSGIPFISGASDFFGCISAQIGWLYQFVFFNSDIPYLNVLASAIGVVVLIGVSKLLVEAIPL